MRPILGGVRIHRSPSRANGAVACALPFLFLLLAVPCFAATIRVPSDQPTIQAGIDAAAPGDVVEVANGVYSGPGNRDIDFRGKEIILRSSNGARKCTLNCVGESGSRHRAFYFHKGEAESSVVDGFTIVNGYADQNGGAIRLVGASPTIRNCVFHDHDALGPSLGNLHGIIGYWNLDDGGQIAGDYVSGNNIPMTSPIWSEGFDGQALEFSLNSSCPTIPPHPSYVAANGFSMSAWIKPNYNPELTHNIIKADNRFTFGVKRGHLFASVKNPNGTQRTVWGSTLLPQNQWRHVAVVFDPKEKGAAADLDSFTGFRLHAESTGLEAGAENEWDNHIREIGNVLYEPDEINPAKRYKLFYSGYSGAYAGNNVYVGWAYSADGLQWTKAGKVHPRPLEDPYVVKRGNIYYLYAEDKADVPFRNIRLLQSFNCLFWTDEGDVFDVRDGGTPYNWESSDVSSPVVWIEDETWYLMYEGRGGGISGRIGLATSDNGRDWTRRPGGSPIFGNGEAGQWDDTNVVTDDILKIDDTYYFTYHGFGRAQSSGFWTGLATSTDLVNWTRYPMNPISPSETLMFLNDESGISVFAVNVDESGITRYLPYVISGPRLFVDGREESYWQRDDTRDEPAAEGMTPMRLACDPGDWRKQFVGSIDELRYYSRPLSARELHNPISTFAMPLGGAVSCESASAPAFFNCIFYGNQSASAGGAVFADETSAPSFINCTLSGNSAFAGRGGGAFLQGGGAFSNSIIWGNDAAVAPFQISGNANVSYCNIDDKVVGVNNLRSDPQFIDPGRGDFHLNRASMCINSGGDGFGNLSDLDGKDRVMCGQVDMGAYEYGVGDPNCDRRIDVLDFETFYVCMALPESGLFPPPCKAADFDNDGDVDLADFGQFGVAFNAEP